MMFGKKPEKSDAFGDAIKELLGKCDSSMASRFKPKADVMVMAKDDENGDDDGDEGLMKGLHGADDDKSMMADSSGTDDKKAAIADALSDMDEDDLMQLYASLS